jgi:superfamily I DNA/RNA helicase
MVNIPIYSRDNSKDYLYILKALNEIPFNVGKNLLADFLIGNTKNPSINKNFLFNLYNFSKLNCLEKNEVLSLIQNCINKGIINQSPSIFNKNIVTLSIAKNGQEELIDPSIEVKKQENNKIKLTEITDEEMKAFAELKDFLGNLNLEQKKAIVSSRKKILCIAGAGTGKTTVLTKKIEFINKLKRVRGEQILAITFTKKAKEQMQEKLKILGIRGVFVETFNSFCEKILLKNSTKIYKKRMRIAEYSEKMMGILKALDNLGITIDDAINKYFSKNQIKNKTRHQLQNLFMNDCYTILDYHKLKNKKIENFAEKIKGKNYESAKMIYNIIKFLEVFLINAGLRTYSDQISETLKFFKEDKKNIPIFEYILIDEYQDVNFQQVQLIELLNPNNLFCVGDPRQSIYGWRGSDIRFIKGLEKEPLTEVIYLKKNYRSTESIVSLMNKSIKEMNMPDLENSNNKNKHLKIYSLPSEEMENDFISKKILLSNTERNEIFILARTNKRLLKLSDFLKKKNIKHIIKTEEEKKREAKEDEITLATVHAIKGLEAKEVFLISATKKNFPCKGNEHPILEMIKMYDYDKLEEEKRLFYVAISRAKEKLHITHSGKSHTKFITEEIKSNFEIFKY